MFLRRFAAALFILLAGPLRAGAAPATVASRDDAFIAHDAGSNTWTIGSGDFSATVTFDGGGALTFDGAKNKATGRTWPLKSVAAATIGGERVVLRTSGSTSLVASDAVATDYTVQLTLTFEHRTTHARISRVYAAAPGSPTIETWTRIEAAADSSLTLSDINTIDFTTANATVKWLTGLRGDNADTLSESAFSLGERDLGPGERIEIGAEGRSTEQFVPFALVDDGTDEFYTGLMWSGAWRLAFERIGADSLKVNAYFPGVETTVSAGTPFDFPHAFFGIKPRASSDESGALRRFILQDIRQGRPFRPLVTFNTWFPYGARINQGIVQREIIQAAALGIELVVVDAGWYIDAGGGGPYDYTSGLGTYTVDEHRFPEGLGMLAQTAHDAGLKFGIWVEPERVALDAMNGDGLASDAWLARHDGDIGSETAGQICLGTAAARRWILDRVSAVVDETHADYLKWDNNFWINCNSTDHDHGPKDGNMAHVNGLYSVLAELRRRYPDLLIENVSGGGNRIDFGMLAYTDVAWMDDRSAPAPHVRHNIEGLTFAFPPAYLLSFIVDNQDESVRTSADPFTVVRSRMPGVLGVSVETSRLAGSEIDVLATQIAEYKQIRDVIATGNATLLSDQAPVDDAKWDVLQELTDDGRRLVLFAYKNNDDDDRLIVRLRRLDAEATYDVRSLDVGPLGSASGEALMTDGIEILHEAGSTRSHIIIVTAR